MQHTTHHATAQPKARLLPNWPSTQLVLLLSDTAALAGTFLTAMLARELAGGTVNLSLHLGLVLFLMLAPCINFFNSLYATTPPAMPEELRCLALSTTLAYFCIGVFFLLNRSVEHPSRLIILAAWLLSLTTVPLARYLVRRHFCQRPWWGRPTIVFGHGGLTTKLITQLLRNPLMGLKPQALVPNTPWTRPVPEGVTIIDDAEVLPYLNQHPDACALVVIPTQDDAHCSQHVRTVIQNFPNVILVPQEFAGGDIPFWVRPMELGRVLGLQVRQNLLDPRRLALKRCMDFVGAICIGVLLFPVIVVIAIAIAIESPGNPFFRQDRIGRNGSLLRILKFRSMVPDAEAHLERCLAADPALMAEWQADQKLRNDPRITRVGHLLRKTSLDELPQLWNVLWGEMSLVGPRPIVKSEIVKYGEVFGTYLRVRPGMTGLWQVSGRNDLSYAERVAIDRYYICNWSTWLDILILFRTFPVVFCRKGAY